MRLYVQPPQGVRLRTQPNGLIIRTVLPNTEVEGFETRKIGAILWQRVTVAGRSGWMAAQEGSTLYLALTRPGSPPVGSTPMDGKTALWLWHPAAPSVRALAESMPAAVNALVVKTSEGGNWQGVNDPHPALGMTSVDRVDAWVAGLAERGIDFHAWCVPHGVNIAAEAQRIIDVCNRPGVRSMILDVEPHSGFWTGSRAAVRDLMERVRAAIPAGFHIGLSVDPRPAHYGAIFPDAWGPFVDGVYPQIYWRTFGQSPGVAIGVAYSTWGRYGRPIVPVLQGNALAADIVAARRLVVAEYNAKGISYWRWGVMNSGQLGALSDTPKRVALANLNIRAEPKSTSSFLGLLQAGSLVETAAQVVNGYIQLLNRTGWVLSAWLKEV